MECKASGSIAPPSYVDWPGFAVGLIFALVLFFFGALATQPAHAQLKTEPEEIVKAQGNDLQFGSQKWEHVEVGSLQKLTLHEKQIFNSFSSILLPQLKGEGYPYRTTRKIVQVDYLDWPVRVEKQKTKEFFVLNQSNEVAVQRREGHVYIVQTYWTELFYRFMLFAVAFIVFFDFMKANKGQGSREMIKFASALLAWKVYLVFLSGFLFLLLLPFVKILYLLMICLFLLGPVSGVLLIRNLSDLEGKTKILTSVLCVLIALYDFLHSWLDGWQLLTTWNHLISFFVTIFMAWALNRLGFLFFSRFSWGAEAV